MIYYWNAFQTFPSEEFNDFSPIEINGQNISFRSFYRTGWNVTFEWWKSEFQYNFIFSLISRVSFQTFHEARYCVKFLVSIFIIRQTEYCYHNEFQLYRAHGDVFFFFEWIIRRSNDLCVLQLFDNRNPVFYQSFRCFLIIMIHSNSFRRNLHIGLLSLWWILNFGRTFFLLFRCENILEIFAFPSRQSFDFG